MAAETTEEWEEMTVMMELPDLDSRKQSESHIQILGLATEKPLIKINNQLFTAQLHNTLGSHLLLEVENNSDVKTQKTQKKVITNMMVTDKTFKLEPVYLEKKSDQKDVYGFGKKHQQSMGKSDSS
ncbi:uncharacterized protein LOC131936471 [Physella acuta]|uniref:uncharacterized protein LOC131936471 n=1 Tax=Physella acuta TaxID=109671 RepID=UPI0027DC1CBF|nr:uncharacterized protein LOC131936471 [Physella acuta]